MPYIKQEKREILDPIINDFIKSIPANAVMTGYELDDGDFNYIITKIITTFYYGRYKRYNAAMGLLECVKQELYRRAVAPYEDEKCKENGDVYK